MLTRSGRFGKALVRGDSYERGVQKTIANVKNLVQTLNGTANRSMQNRLYQMDSRQMMMNDMQIKMQMEIREQQAMIKALTQKADENEEKAVSSRNVLLQMMYRLLASNPNYDFKTNNCKKPVAPGMIPLTQICRYRRARLHRRARMW